MQKPHRIARSWMVMIMLALIGACSGDTGARGPAGPSTPVIQNLAATGLPAAPAGTVEVEVVAESAEALDLTYAWSVEGEGWAFADGASSDTVTLTAPDSYDASGALTVKVTDSDNRTATGMLTLTTEGNTAPVIHTLSVSKNPARRNQPFKVLVSAEDPNGDALAYTWTAPNGINIESGQGTSEAVLRGISTTSGVVEVIVSDGQSGTGTGRLYVSAVNGVWKAPRLIQKDNAAPPYSPQLAVDAHGDALAVWYQSDGTHYSISANRYLTGSGWGTAELIETGAGNAIIAQVAVDARGNALAVWQQHDGTRYNIWANHYTPGSGWGTAELIETTDTGHAELCQIAMDAAGNALAIWQHDDGTRTNIRANRYTAGSAWGTAELIEIDNAGGAQAPQIAVDAQGNALAVWRQYDGTRWNIQANRYIAGSGWGTAELIETGVWNAYSPQVALDAQGNAMAVWEQWSGSQRDIWANRYTADSGWGTAEMIETANAGDAKIPRIAVDAKGDALAVWRQSDGLWYDIWANRYTLGSGWGTAKRIGTSNTGDADAPQIAIDSHGNALAVWHHVNVWANRYTPGGGWSTAEIIHIDPGADPQVAFGADGNALAIWRKHDGTQWEIHASPFE